MRYTTVIGLEIHAELQTKTKIFCGCANSFGNERNSNCCPGCAGLPGALPVLNRMAVELAIAAGLTLGCEISRYTIWDRKNYFYPDNSKAYQISQLYAPLCIGGGLEINGRFIRLNRIHLEEDAGKLIHEGRHTFMDYNRAGVPLIEIVTEPDIRSSDEAAAFVEKVRQALVYAGVCDGRMEQGSLRVDANVSIMPEGSDKFGTRVEVKNVNSFKFIKKAIDFEAERQEELVRTGGRVIQETRRYDEFSDETFSMRTKEDAHDYRYFPDPDILPLVITREDINRIKESLTESPHSRFARYTNIFGLSEKDAETLLARKLVADFFDRVTELGAEPKNAANIIKGELLYIMNREDTEPLEIPISPEDFVKILILAEASKINREGLKKAIDYMYHNKKSADEAVKENNLLVEEDLEMVAGVVRQVIADNQTAVSQYKSGNEKVLSFLFGQCAKQLKGKAHPQTINAELKKALEQM